nr:hypothetical protein RKE32_08980 [Streptomyces sp. Li-HN-5-13]
MKTWRALVPSPVKVTVVSSSNTVPVAVCLAMQADSSSMTWRSGLNSLIPAGSLIGWPGGVMS